jgi:hypothetical protein
MAVSSLKNKSKLSTLTSPFDIDLGGMIPLSTVTVGAGGQASVEFTSIPAYYEHLQIRGIGRSSQVADGTNYIYLRFNGSSQTEYAYHDLTGNGASASAGGTANSTQIIAGQLPRANQLASSFAVNIIDILDYANTNKNKTVRCLSGIDYNGLSNSQPGYIRLQSGLWINANAVTSIQLTSESGNFVQYSTFALYGIKRAGA